MSKLNGHATQIKDKYIRRAEQNLSIYKKKRGLQSEINKLEGIKRILMDNFIEEKELIRFRNELIKLNNILNHLMVKV